MSGLYRLDEDAPEIAADAYVAPGAHVIGRVILGARSSVWFGAVLRGDNEPIEIRARANIQDGCVLHTDPGFPLLVEEDCTIGHRAILHGCHVGAGTLIGMGATLLNGAWIGPGCLVGANALVTEGKRFEAGSLIVGAPARAVRKISAETAEMLAQAADIYVRRAARYRSSLERIEG